jgi:pimeloyl-ACP methyl ester carboxylesterase
MTTRTAAIAEKYVTLSHGRTRYLEAGTGYPTVLLHGVNVDAGGDSWRLNIGPLATKLRVLAPDFVGWGLGDRLDREYSFGYLVDFIREFQDALGLEKSNIVGHSMGGWVSTVFAYESPNRVNKLVLVCSGGARIRTLATMTEFMPPTRDQIRQQLQAHVSPAAKVDLDKWADEAHARTQIPGAVEAYRKILRHMNDAENRKRYHTMRRMSHIPVPTLVVWGRQDATNDMEMAEDTHRLIKGSKLVVLDTDHFVPTKMPDEFNKAVLEFLA